MLQNYVRNLVNFDISVVGHLDNFDKMQSYLDQGDNVVCLANHQTEADPGTTPSGHADQILRKVHHSTTGGPWTLLYPRMFTVCNSNCLKVRGSDCQLCGRRASARVMLRA